MKSSRVLTPILCVTFFGMAAALLIGFLAETDVIVTAPGELRPLRYGELRPPVEGIAVEVYHREGDAVRAGDAILRVESDAEILTREKVRKDLTRLTEDLQDNERKAQERKTRLDLAQANRREAVADVTVQETKLAQTLASLLQAQAAPEAIEINSAEEKLKQQDIAENDAKKALEDARMLIEKGLLSEQGYQKAQSAYQTAQSETKVRRNSLELLKKTRLGVEIERAQSNVDSQRASLQAAQARLQERTHQVKLAELGLNDRSEDRRLQAELEKAKLEEDRLNKSIEDKTLRAPISGILFDFNTKPGQTVTHKENYGWVYDVSGYLFYTRVKQVDLSDVEEGQAALLYFDALPYRLEGTFDATVYDVSRVASPPASQGGSNAGPLTVSGGGDTMPQALVRLKMVEGDPRNERLRVGFTGLAEIVVGRSSLIGLLFGSRPRNPPKSAPSTRAAALEAAPARRP